MTTTATLLVELVAEELPPKALKSLGEAFADSLANGLRSRDFLSEQSTAVPYATPRRMAVAISHVRSVAPDAELNEKLMPAKVARDNLEALRKKLAPLGRGQLATPTLDARDGPDQLYVLSDGKADYVYLRRLAKGQPLARGLQDALDEAIESLPIPRVMIYARRDAYYNDVKFVRPAHRLVALHGADIVPVTALGLQGGRTTDGHRFLGRRAIDIASAEAYAPTLEAEGKVIPSFSARRDKIAAEL
ncbi:MAG TPA: glycine--tRNA ligase subunit beta, partial [Casimicrobiaceae bacterium]